MSLSWVHFWSFSSKGGQYGRGALEQEDPGGRRVDVAIVARQDHVGELGDLAGQLHAGRAGTDDGERQPALLLGRIGLEFRHLIFREDAVTQIARIFDRLHAGGILGELLFVAEVGVGRTGSENQRVIGQPQLAGVGLPGDHHLVLDIDVLHLGKGHLAVALIAHHAADCWRDQAFREDARGHLIQQRLEQVMVRAVDDCDIHIRLREGLSGVDAAETSADNDNPVTLRHVFRLL